MSNNGLNTAGSTLSGVPATEGFISLSATEEAISVGGDFGQPGQVLAKSEVDNTLHWDNVADITLPDNVITQRMLNRNLGNPILDPTGQGTFNLETTGDLKCDEIVARKLDLTEDFQTRDIICDDILCKTINMANGGSNNALTGVSTITSSGDITTTENIVSQKDILAVGDLTAGGDTATSGTTTSLGTIYAGGVAGAEGVRILNSVIQRDRTTASRNILGRFDIGQSLDNTANDIRGNRLNIEATNVFFTPPNDAGGNPQSANIFMNHTGSRLRTGRIDCNDDIVASGNVNAGTGTFTSLSTTGNLSTEGTASLRGGCIVGTTASPQDLEAGNIKATTLVPKDINGLSGTFDRGIITSNPVGTQLGIDCSNNAQFRGLVTLGPTTAGIDVAGDVRCRDVACRDINSTRTSTFVDLEITGTLTHDQDLTLGGDVVVEGELLLENGCAFTTLITSTNGNLTLTNGTASVAQLDTGILNSTGNTSFRGGVVTITNGGLVSTTTATFENDVFVRNKEFAITDAIAPFDDKIILKPSGDAIFTKEITCNSITITNGIVCLDISCRNITSTGPCSTTKTMTIGGNTECQADLSVSGQSFFTGDVDMTSNLVVDKKITIGTDLAVGGTVVNMKNLPTSSAGLATGDLYVDKGAIKIV